MEDSSCKLCRQDVESVPHILWECGVAQDVWAGSKVCLQKCTTNRGDILQLVDDLMDRFVNTKLFNSWKSNKLKNVSQIYYWINQVMNIISLLILLQNKYSSDSIFFELDLNKKSFWLWLEDGLNGFHNKSLALSLLEIFCFSSSSSPLNVLQVFLMFFKDFWILGWNSSVL